MPQRKYYH